MKCEEPPKKPDKDGGRGQEEDEQPMPVDDGGEADGEDGDDFTSEGELHPMSGRFRMFYRVSQVS